MMYEGISYIFAGLAMAMRQKYRFTVGLEQKSRIKTLSSA